MSDKPESPVLAYQLKLIRDEYKAVNETIRSGDEISKSVKEWAITVWAASIGGALSHPEFRRFVAITAVIPLVFWMVETWHRVVQRKFIWRSFRIMDFVNSESLADSFTAGKLVNFTVMDIGSRRDRTPEFSRFVSAWHVMWFRSLSSVYLSLCALSVGVSLLVWYRGL